MSALYMIVGTLAALGVLVTFHEYGHFWVARRCGVKVLRFSVGFGTPLATRNRRHSSGSTFASRLRGGDLAIKGMGIPLWHHGWDALWEAAANEGIGMEPDAVDAFATVAGMTVGDALSEVAVMSIGSRRRWRGSGSRSRPPCPRRRAGTGRS